MICPNCGNENPPDYVFCDECGAKLKPGEGATEAGTELQDGATSQSVGLSSGDLQTGGVSGVLGTGHGDDMNSSGLSGSLQTGAQGEGDLPAADDAMHSPGPEDETAEYATPTGSEEGAEEAMPGVVPVQASDAEMGEMSAYSEPSGALSEGESAEGGDLGGASPEDASAGTSTGPDDAASESATTGTAGGGELSWAVGALRHLDEAQQSATQGDWAGFGRSLNTLRSYLNSVVQRAPGGGVQPSSSVESDGGISSDDVQPYMGSETGSADGAMSGLGVGAGAGAASSPMATASGDASPSSEQADAASNATPRLVIISTGSEMALPQGQEEITVGREDPSSGIFPDVDLTPYGGEEGGVSRRHARILHIGDDYFVEDLQSTNYTKLDGQRLPAHVRERLEDSTRIDFGRVATIFRRS